MAKLWLTIVAVVVFILVALGVDIEGMDPLRLTAVGLVAFAAAHF
jgi:hypothetical protein